VTVFVSCQLRVQNYFCSVGLAVGDDSLAEQPMVWRKCSPLRHSYLFAYFGRAEFCDLIQSS